MSDEIPLHPPRPARFATDWAWEKAKESSRAFYLNNKEKCKADSKERRDRDRKQIKEFIKYLKTQPCFDCGVVYPPKVMDFDHVRGTKTFNIAQAARLHTSNKRLFTELAKCDLVCANCHRLRTYYGRRHTPSSS